MLHECKGVITINVTLEGARLKEVTNTLWRKIHSSVRIAFDIKKIDMQIDIYMDE